MKRDYGTVMNTIYTITDITPSIRKVAIVGVAMFGVMKPMT